MPLGDPDCEICGGDGLIKRDGEPGPCDCRMDEIQESRLKELRENANIPPRYRDACLDDFTRDINEDVANTASKFTERFDQVRGGETDTIGFYIFGGVGTGKTHLGYAVMNQLIDQEKPCFATSVPDMLEKLRPSRDDKKISEYKETMREIPFLFIDDIGKENPTEWVRTTLWSLINHRYNWLKPTFLTSNHPPSELKSDTVGAIADRISEMFKTVELEGESKRKND
jgi:DNA replication protein DnaC